jgi:prepilin-type N-terminal cleavage/methylation domain-containing protein
MTTVAGSEIVWRAPHQSVSRRSCGFTLLELLAVIAVIAILAAILIPSASAARQAAGRAKTRVQFSQWAAAIEAFRGEYGYYPAFTGANLVNASADATVHPFHDVLAARRRDGSALPGGSSAAAQNPKRIAFCAFTESDFAGASSAASALLCDAFGNTEIAVLVDRNLDGVLNAADFGTLPLVAGARPSDVDFPATGLRLRVAFYGPAPGSTADSPGFICSWK